MKEIELKFLRCGNSNLEKCKVNTRIALNGQETQRYGVISQIVYQPTDALICHDCGHVELFVDFGDRV